MNAAALPVERLAEAWPGTWNPLGVTLDAEGANVASGPRAPHAVDLCLFDENGRERRVALAESTFNTFHGYVPGVRAGQRYGFRVHGPWDPWRGNRCNPAKLLLDPYARAIEGRYVPPPGHAVGTSATTTRCATTATPRPSSRAAWSSATTLRLGAATPGRDPVDRDGHLRGPRQGPHHAATPEIPEHLRGTYAGLAHPAVIEHLTRLGVTAVELLPVHHFVTEATSWPTG